jgi:hypothetical protein
LIPIRETTFENTENSDKNKAILIPIRETAFEKKENSDKKGHF